MARRTPLFEVHRSLNARFVDFGGWEMPVQYTSQIAEHHAVRRAAGIFDVSHMCVLDLQGVQIRAFLRQLLANNIDKLQQPGSALYSCMLNEQGGVVDDLITYYLDADRFRLVVNAGTRDKDLQWIRGHAAPFGVQVTERTDVALLAVQGPQARATVAKLLSAQHATTVLGLATFHAAQVDEWWVARTGYTGEDGFELVLPAVAAERTWRDLTARGVVPCGLGARDTLRLEAGMNLYGLDMDDTTHPYESGLGWTVALEPSRDFIGRAALEAIRRQPAAEKRVQAGLLLEERGVLRAHQVVHVDGAGQGEVTSGTFSPTLERSIALARVPALHGAHVQVDIRGRLLPARIVRPPFVRFGKSMLQPTEEVQ
ncbi:MAG: glycine cleavage system aminomethyltransferase GcvT [Sinobacteraceae bacterium]|nr:glycine cleavage system aminomethyltransferase GcvT [Nevskiaceae bacterium]